MTEKRTAAGQVRLAIPDKAKVEKSMEAYARAVRDDKRSTCRWHSPFEPKAGKPQ